MAPLQIGIEFKRLVLFVYSAFIFGLFCLFVEVFQSTIVDEFFATSHFAKKIKNRERTQIDELEFFCW